MSCLRSTLDLSSSAALWRTYPPNTNYGQLVNLHKTAITDVQWSLLSSSLYTIGADGNLCISDLTTGERIKRVKAHRGVINSLDRTATAGTELLVTGGDDGWVRVWDVGSDGQGDDAKEPVKEWSLGFPVTAVCWSVDAAQVFVGGLDNCIHVGLPLPAPCVSLVLTRFLFRSTTYGLWNDSTFSKATQTPRLQSHCLLAKGITLYRPHCLQLCSYTTFGHSLPTPTGKLRLPSALNDTISNATVYLESTRG